MRLNPYQLSPMGPGFGWGSRLIEIVGQTLALVLIAPLVLVWRALDWLMERILP